MLGLRWVAGLTRRRPGRVVGLTAAVAMAVVLTASLGAFFSASRSRMTADAVSSVPVDWQVQLSPHTDVVNATSTVSSAPDVTRVLPVGYAAAMGFRTAIGGTVQTTGPGVVLGIPAGYAAAFPGEIRPLIGSSEGVLLAQQTAANLGATIGSDIAIERRGLPPAHVKVAGVVDLPAADSLFQAIGAAPGSAPTAPPDNVALLPAALFAQIFPPGTPDVTTQLHVELARTLPADPGAAFADVTGRAKNLEAALSGSGRVGDNLAARLDAARTDAIYAQLLFLFLGLPGVVLAALLAGVVAAAGRERRRQEQALLRLRGAPTRTIVRLAGAEAVAVGVAGSVIGLSAAVLAGHLAFGQTRFGATTAQAWAWVAIAIAVGIGLATIAIVVPAASDARMLTVGAARATIGRGRPPLWMRLYLDVVLLAAGGIVYWQAMRSGYQVVLAPEGVPTISVSTFTLMAPALFWAGAALLAWRLSSGMLGRGRSLIKRAARPVAGGMSGVVASSMSRQRRSIARATILMALTASFALTVAIFNATYAAQATVDAQLTNGADVSAMTTTLAGLPAGIETQAARLPGVASATTMQHRFAYVGNDLQDLYGIEPATISATTPMSNAFFGNGDAAATLTALAAQSDGVLLSDESVHDFQLTLGDTVRLRLQTAPDGAYQVIPFTFIGIAREFPTAPHDSFIVANAAYVAKATGTPSVQTLLVRTSGSPTAAADEIRSLLGPSSGVHVQDIVTQQRATLSSLTAVDLHGLTRMELVYALLMAAACSGLVLALGITERRRSYAIASALGARKGQLASFVWAEATFVVAVGIALGGLIGWGIAQVLVKILTGVFDPPPSGLTIPWGYLGIALAAAIGATIVGSSGALRSVRRPLPEVLRDL
ncbi:MAG: FtsX-like permease family protein [Actinomycetota bacterium]